MIMGGARGVGWLGRVVGRARLPAPVVIVGGVGMAPIAPVRVIEEEGERFVFAGSGELGDQVTRSGGVAAVEIRVLRCARGKSHRGGAW